MQTVPDNPQAEPTNTKILRIWIQPNVVRQIRPIIPNTNTNTNMTTNVAILYAVISRYIMAILIWPYNDHIINVAILVYRPTTTCTRGTHTAWLQSPEGGLVHGRQPLRFPLRVEGRNFIHRGVIKVWCLPPGCQKAALLHCVEYQRRGASCLGCKPRATSGSQVGYDCLCPGGPVETSQNGRMHWFQKFLGLKKSPIKGMERRRKMLLHLHTEPSGKSENPKNVMRKLCESEEWLQ